MRTRVLFMALILSLLVTLGQITSADAKRNHLLAIASPTKNQLFLQDAVEIIVVLNKEADPATFRAWLNGREISDRFTLEGNTLKAVVGPGDGLRTDSETIRTTRDDKGVWFIEGRRDALRKGQRRFNRLRTVVHGLQQQVGIDVRTFRVDCSLFDVFEAMGYAVATDRLWQMELYRRTARGRLAEIFGASQRDSDIMMRTLGYSQEELTNGFAALDGESKAVIAGYVAGINRRIAEIEGTPMFPFEFVALGVAPDNWTVEDVLAWCALLQRNFDPEALDQAQLDNAALLEHLVGLAMTHLNQPDPSALEVQTLAMAMFQDLRWPNDPAAQTYIVNVEAMAGQNSGMDGAMRRIPGLKKACDRLKERRDKIDRNLKKINAKVKMGSYAWVVSGRKTASGNPIIYSGPQMGFSVPSIVCEGSIRAAGLNISGMTVPGIPGIIIGRTPHHAWSMQVGHAHTTDYFVEALNDIVYRRQETIPVRGTEDTIVDVYRTENGPVINVDPLISWRYAHWGHEFDIVGAFLELARAESMDAFGAAIEKIAVCQHFCYADRDGNIAYWMSGRDPVRPMDTYLGPYLYFLPQGALLDRLDWDDDVLVPRSHARNPERGFFAGWNNKTSPVYFNAFNSTNDVYGPFQRAHVIEAYLAGRDDLSFEEVRDLALNIATTDSFNGGGNPWSFVADDFKTIVTAALGTNDDLDHNREVALAALESWDGHFVAGSPDEWVDGPFRSQGWVLMNDWLQEVIELTFADELYDEASGEYLSWNRTLLFNVILHALGAESSGLTTSYDWFTNLADPAAPQTLEDIVVSALDAVMAGYEGAIPSDVPRKDITYKHDMLPDPVWRTPYASRSTYAHVVEFGRKGPVRIESMFPLGESGNILMDFVDGNPVPVFDDHFFSMTTKYDAFAPRDFPLFSEEKRGAKR